MPCRAVNIPSTTTPGGDAERLAEGARLRPLRHLAGARLLVGVGDVPHALARAVRQLRTGLEHDDARIGDSSRSTRAYAEPIGPLPTITMVGWWSWRLLRVWRVRCEFGGCSASAGSISSERRPGGSRTAATTPDDIDERERQKIGANTST